MEALQLHGYSDRRGDDLLLAPPAWHALAACAGEDTEAWFPERGDGPSVVARALAVCAGCPAREPCLEWALDHDEQGVWGGTTDADRRHIRRGEPVPERKPARTAPAAPERPGRALAPCGTPAAYARHRRRGEDACEDCKRAQRDKGRAWREQAA